MIMDIIYMIIAFTIGICIMDIQQDISDLKKQIKELSDKLKKNNHG